jgi:hypothetical protein
MDEHIAQVAVNKAGRQTGVMRHRSPANGSFQWDDRPGAPASGWISAAIRPFEPGP